MTKQLVSTSKFLSLLLRHQPETVGVALDLEGWIEVDTLLGACHAHGKTISRELLDEIVATSDKKRFAFSPDGLRIRANQGHSVAVDLGLTPREPPALLFHGTIEIFLDSIRRGGLIKGKRQHVHLSSDQQTASKVGLRRGRPVVLTVQAEQMHHSGHAFFLSENGVWLVDAVPPEFLQFPT